MNALARYTRLSGAFVEFAFSRSTMFRMDLVLRITMDLCFYAAEIVFYKVLFLHSATIGGWSQAEALVFIGAYITLDALQMTFITNGMSNVTATVNTGDFDFYLVRPVSTLFISVFRYLDAGSSLNLVFALSVLAWAVTSLPVSVSAGQVATFLFLFANGMILYFCVRLLFVVPSFWTSSSKGIHHAFFSFVRLCETPHTVFRGWLRYVMLIVLPYGLMASLPAEQLFRPSSGWDLLRVITLSTGVTCLFVLVTRFVWARALRVYGSASS